MLFCGTSFAMIDGTVTSVAMIDGTVILPWMLIEQSTMIFDAPITLATLCTFLNRHCWWYDTSYLINTTEIP